MSEGRQSVMKAQWDARPLANEMRVEELTPLLRWWAEAYGVPRVGTRAEEIAASMWANGFDTVRALRLMAV